MIERRRGLGFLLKAPERERIRVGVGEELIATWRCRRVSRA